ncbi:MAG: outer membrane protein transport protein, partial [Kiritimatiellales bacterium]
MINKPHVAPSPVVIFITTILVSSALFADGYRNPPEGAQAIGMFGGYRAFADDANATIHNSANLVDLEQPMVQINTTFGYGRNEFKNGTVSDETKNPFFALPGFAAAMPFKDGKYAVGLATYIPFGRSVEWKDSGYFSTTPNVSYSGSMMVADFSPNFAIRITDSLSIGVGADFYYGQVKQWTCLAPGGALVSKLTADGTTVGWNAAATWKMTQKQRLALTYHSPFTIKYSGEDYLSNGTKGDANA